MKLFHLSDMAPRASEKTALVVLRVSCAFFVVGAYLVALFNPSWIVALTSLTWAVVAGGFLAPYVYGLFWRGVTKAGAIAGMASGMIMMHANAATAKARMNSLPFITFP